MNSEKIDYFPQTLGRNYYNFFLDFLYFGLTDSRTITASCHNDNLFIFLIVKSFNIYYSSFNICSFNFCLSSFDSISTGTESCSQSSNGSSITGSSFFLYQHNSRYSLYALSLVFQSGASEVNSHLLLNIFLVAAIASINCLTIYSLSSHNFFHINEKDHSTSSI